MTGVIRGLGSGPQVREVYGSGERSGVRGQGSGVRGQGSGTDTM